MKTETNEHIDIGIDDNRAACFLIWQKKKIELLREE